MLLDHVQVATVLAIVAAVYMRIFVKDTTLKPTAEATENNNVPLLDSYRPDKTKVFNNAPTPKDIICFLKNSRYIYRS